jgi:ABC-type Fe3+ transport system permease subunit
MVPLYRFPGRTFLASAQALPLLLPSFLLAIGWGNLAAADWLPRFLSPDGLFGCIFVLGLQAVPLVFFATWAAALNLTGSQVDAARLAGGEMVVLRQSAWSCAPVAILAALLAGVLSLSDTGAPLIFGCRSVAVEILTTFAALYDFELAGRQCLALAGLVLLLTTPLLIVGLRRLAAAILARQTRPITPYIHARAGWVLSVALLAVLVIGIGIPTLGVCLPAVNDPMPVRALAKAWSTAGATFTYTFGAGAVAVLAATCLALLAGRDLRLRLAVLGVLLLLLAMPPALGAIGTSYAATRAPAAFDWLLRSQLTVAVVLGLRFLPVATVIMMRAVGTLSPSWTDAARVHGVSRGRFLLRVILPLLTPAVLVGVLLVMVLAAADITTTHLLQPTSGRPTLPLAIFTVMANSPEGLVASLCLIYLLGVILLMALGTQLPRWLGRRTT